MKHKEWEIMVKESFYGCEALERNILRNLEKNKLNNILIKHFYSNLLIFLPH